MTITTVDLTATAKDGRASYAYGSDGAAYANITGGSTNVEKQYVSATDFRDVRAYLEFEPSGISADDIITRVQLKIKARETYGNALEIYNNPNELSDYATAEDLWNGLIGDGDRAWIGNVPTDTFITIDLGYDSCLELQDHKTYFLLGIYDPQTWNSTIRKTRFCDYDVDPSTDRPTLIITHEPSTKLIDINADGTAVESVGDVTGGGTGYFDITTAQIVASVWESGDSSKVARGYMEFNTSALNTGQIKKVELYFEQRVYTGTRTFYIREMVQQHADYATAEDLFNGLDDGDLYWSGTLQTNGGVVTELGETARVQLNQHPTWFGVSLLINEASPTSANDQVRVASSNVLEMTPYLIVTYGRRRSHVG